MKKIKITQIKSIIGRIPSHRATLKGLGLRRIRSVVFRKNTPSIQGMIKKISYLLHIEEV
ncbi:50S ribosomal protein L30 [Buchnera aphidicola (Mindarus keteleerifoliae)]|uniref:50S ribosomal protein L30 n=1 Tax=Buchnera aphidicola TaxID=9 RepID=UPI0031B6A058